MQGLGSWFLSWCRGLGLSGQCWVRVKAWVRWSVNGEPVWGLGFRVYPY